MNNPYRKYFFYIIFISCLLGCGAFDVERAESKRIIGNIYVINLNLSEHPGFYAVFKEKSGYERHLLKSDEYIDYLKATDSLMLIKTKAKPDISYYLIYHDKGDSILSTQTVLDFEFEKYEHSINAKYYFVAEKKEE